MTAHGARIKICGLTRPQDIEAVNAALPDYAGFVFAPGRRTVSLAQAAMLRQRLDRRIVPVGVFMDAPLDEVLAACSAGVVEAVQLHGSEDASYIEELKDACLVPLIKAVRLRSDGRPTHDIPHGADYVLFDGLVPGSGERAAWSVALRRYQKRFFLAGGICLANLD
ncbi:MAG: phosphoribosylanthranilate isomerase, partial [Coriobacteriales bacterium]|nr:phosphoribosylanthranilate isomerase [Coriobacteriales bacterium]